MESEESLGRFFTRIKKTPNAVAPESSKISVRSSSKKRKKAQPATTTTTEKDVEDENETSNRKGTRTVNWSKSRPFAQRRPFRTWRNEKKGVKPTAASPQRNSKKNEHKVFNVAHAKKIMFKDWKKEASSYLPSVTGKAQEKIGEGSDKVKISAPASKTSSSSDDSFEHVPVMLAKKKRQSYAAQLMDIKRSRQSSFGLGLKRSSRTKSTDEEAGPEKEDTHSKPRGSEDDDDEDKKLKDSIAALRELCEPLHTRREKRQELIKEAELNRKLSINPNGFRIKDCLLNFAQWVAIAYLELKNVFTVWEKDIHEINCRFGLVVASYFIWLRRIVHLNVLTFLISLFLLIIPEFVEQYFVKRVAEHGRNKPFEASHLLHGEGYFHSSHLYYSGYHTRHNDNDIDDLINNAAIRFCIAILLIFILNTYTLFSLIKKYYRSVHLESKVVGLAKMETFKCVICAWDFSCGDERASGFLHKMIKKHLNILSKGSGEEVRELTEIEEKDHLQFLGYLVKKFGLKGGNFAMHIVSNLTAVLCCMTLGTIVYWLSKLKLAYYLECIKERDDDKTWTLSYNGLCPGGDLSLQTWILSLPSLFTSVVTLGLFKLLTTVGEMEHFQRPEMSIYALMIRGGIFNLTCISVFFLFWIFEGKRMAEKGYVTETVVGKEMYRLVVIQGMIDVFINFASQFVYHFSQKRLKNTKEYKKPRFQPEYYAQEMFYIDSIARLGTLFCPPISLLVTIRLVADFYLKKYNLIHFSRHDTYIFQASFVYVPYLATFFISYLVGITFLGFFMTELTPSQIDGPFLNYTHSYTEVLRLLVERANSTKWISSLFESGSLLIVLAILSSCVYFCRQWAKAYEPILHEVNDLILQERTDKELLLKAFFDIARVTDRPKGKATTEYDITSEEDAHRRIADQTDQKIEKLIHHVRKRRSLDRNALGLLHQFQQSGKVNHHRKQMEDMVHEIVQERQRRKNVVLTEAPTSSALKELIRKHEASLGMKPRQHTTNYNEGQFFNKKNVTKNKSQAKI